MKKSLFLIRYAPQSIDYWISFIDNREQLLLEKLYKYFTINQINLNFQLEG